MSQVFNSAAAPKAKSRKRKVVIASAIAGAVLIPAGAWAAVNIFGFGQFNASATAIENNLVVTDSKLTKKLVPGQTVGAEAKVKNTNDFPVTITSVLVRESTLAVTPADEAECKTTVEIIKSGADTTWPGEGGGVAHRQAIKAPVTLNPGETKLVEVPQAVKQAGAATKLCGVSAEFAVEGKVGS